MAGRQIGEAPFIDRVEYSHRPPPSSPALSSHDGTAEAGPHGGVPRRERSETKCLAQVRHEVVVGVEGREVRELALHTLGCPEQEAGMGFGEHGGVVVRVACRSHPVVQVSERSHGMALLVRHAQAVVDDAVVDDDESMAQHGRPTQLRHERTPELFERVREDHHLRALAEFAEELGGTGHGRQSGDDLGHRRHGETVLLEDCEPTTHQDVVVGFVTSRAAQFVDPCSLGHSDPDLGHQDTLEIQGDDGLLAVKVSCRSAHASNLRPMPHRAIYQQLFVNNRRWVEMRRNEDADYFERLAQGQSPRHLFIGCSDSRVNANEITGSATGDLFVHRNVANLVLATDVNLMSVLQFAVEVLKVDHVIVCGHYGCGGVYAAVDGQYHGTLDMWLTAIRDVYRLHHEELDAIEDPHVRHRRLVELNVEEQVYRLSATAIIQKAWPDKVAEHVHGWVYDIREGLLRDLNVDPSHRGDRGVYALGTSPLSS